jgi:uncharacterized membrane protein
MNRRVAWVLAVVVCVFTGVYATSGLFPFWHFDSGSDLAIFDQAIWHLSRFESPASTISGFSNILADHFYPILGLFAPLYWVFPSPEALIAAQAALLALSIVPVFLCLRERVSVSAALAVSVAYGLFWGMQRTAAFDVHEFAFAPLTIATMLLGLLRCRWWLFWIGAAATALVKEDLIPLVGCAGLYLVVQGERRQGVTAIALSLAAFVLLVAVVLPRIGDSAGYRYAGGYVAVLARPWTIPVVLVTPPIKLQTMMSWVAAFAFLPLASPLATLAIPLALERFLSASANHWGAIYHYSAPLAPIMAVSAGDGLARIARRVADERVRSRVLTTLAAACVVVSAVVPGHQPLWRSFAPKYYESTAAERTSDHALQQIPREASVVAQTPIAAHLSQRDQIYLLAPGAPDADFVVAQRTLSVWPLDDRAQLDSLIEERRRHGYDVIADDGGWIVLRRRTLAAPPAGSPSGRPPAH